MVGLLKFRNFHQDVIESLHNSILSLALNQLKTLVRLSASDLIPKSMLNGNKKYNWVSYSNNSYFNRKGTHIDNFQFDTSQNKKKLAR